MKKSIKKALQFIKNQQQKDGGFLELSSQNKNNFSQAKKYNSVFPSTLILSCLDLVNGSDEIKKKLADFLLTQQVYNFS